MTCGYMIPRLIISLGWGDPMRLEQLEPTGLWVLLMEPIFRVEDRVRRHGSMGLGIFGFLVARLRVPLFGMIFGDLMGPIGLGCQVAMRLRLQVPLVLKE